MKKGRMKKAIALLCCTSVFFTAGCGVIPHAHKFGESTESSRLKGCQLWGCHEGIFAEQETPYSASLSYTLDDAKKAQIDGELQAILDDLTAIGAYEEGVTPSLEETEAFLDKLEAIEASLKYIDQQYQYATILYDVNPFDTQTIENLQDVLDYSLEVEGQYYALFQKIYDSNYRTCYFAGMTEGEIVEFLADYNQSSDEELLLFQERNNEILTYNSYNVEYDNSIPILYSEYVFNNNMIAKKLGYDNFMEYAYAEEYMRDYSYTEMREVASLLVEYLSPLLNEFYDRYSQSSANPDLNWQEKTEYNATVASSFFSNTIANEKVNNFFDVMEQKEGASQPISFSDSVNKLIEEGNYFLGKMPGAYTWYIEKDEMPIMYFGEDSLDSFTFVHEFGHYMDTCYNKGLSSMMDLCETHSQGLEMLFLHYLKSDMEASSYDLIKEYTFLNAFWLILNSMAVNAFEDAVYTNTYTGKDSDVYMKDGKITANEYDALFTSILYDFGLSEVSSSTYWRFVAFDQAAYYVSYALSMASSLQLYFKAELEGFEAAKTSYFKLITYTDEGTDMTYEEVLEYAGLYAYDDEELYKMIGNYFKQ